MRNSFCVCLLWIGLLLSVKVSSATLTLLDESKGLSHTFVKDITTDKRGVVWIATYSGLNTYDGYIIREIPTFKTIQVRCIKYDSLSDRLWVGTDKGLWYINTVTSEIINCTQHLKQKLVTNIAIKSGTVYVGFLTGSILKIDSNMSCRFIFSSQQLNKSYQIAEKSLSVDVAGNVYVKPTQINKIVRVEAETLKSAYLDIKAVVDFSLRDDQLIVNTGNSGVQLWSTVSGKAVFNKILDSINHVLIDPQFSYMDREGNLFVTYHSIPGMIGVNLLPNGKAVETGNKDILRNRFVTSMHKDVYGIVWVGTSKGLIKIVEQKELEFNSLLSRSSSPLSIRQITGTPQGDFFVGTYYGIYVNPHKDKNDLVPITNPGFSPQSRALLYDSGYLYIGSESEKDFFFRYNLKLKVFDKSFYTFNNTDEVVSAVYSIVKDNSGVFWLGTNRGLASYSPVTKKLILHRHDRFDTGIGSLKFIAQSSNPNVIVTGGENGLALINIHSGIQRKIDYELDPDFPKDEIIFVSEGPDHKIWCGSKGSGIIVVDKDSYKITRLNRSHGLSNNEVYSILWANADTAWISTMNGLCRYVKSSHSFTNYFMENGLTENEFNQNSSYKDEDGRFYFGGMNGITVFDPDKFSSDVIPVSIFSSTVSKWDSKVAAFTDILYSESQTISVKPSDHLLSFSFGLSDKSESDYNTYFYRIKGLYNEWMSLGNQNSLRLEGLPAGLFVVQIIGYNKQGTRTSNMLEYPIRIVQVFYKTWWFFASIAFVLSATVLAYFKWRINQLNKMQQLRTHIASNLHDEIGTLLTRITMAAENLQLRPHQVEDKKGTLEKITVLSRVVNSTMSDVLWAIDARNDFAGSFSERMRELAEGVFESKEISFYIDSDEKNEFQRIKPDQRQQLFLIYKEAIHNILKHSKATTVSIMFKYDTKPKLKITNDGAWEKLNAGGQGLKNMEMRAGKIGAIFSYKHEGETFTVEVNG